MEQQEHMEVRLEDQARPCDGAGRKYGGQAGGSGEAVSRNSRDI
jgi:hypothetical protein